MYYRKALEINPRFAVPYFGLGDPYLRQGRVAEAVGMYEQGLKLDPENGLSQQRLAGAKALLQAGKAEKEEVRALLESSGKVSSPSWKRQRNCRDKPSLNRSLYLSGSFNRMSWP